MYSRVLDAKCSKGNPTYDSLGALPVPVDNFSVLRCCFLKGCLCGNPLAMFEGILSAVRSYEGFN